MRRIMVLTLAGTTVAVLSMPPAAEAWGFEAHKFIMEHAIALLPMELRPLFERDLMGAEPLRGIATRAALGESIDAEGAHRTDGYS